MVKMMFMLHRKTGFTREECVAEWTGAQHLSGLDGLKAAGLRRYIQNPATGEEREGAPDGIGELWFDDPTAMDRVMTGPAMATMFKDAERFLDLDRSYPLVVEESVLVE